MKSKLSKIFNTISIACIISYVLLSSYLVADIWARFFTEAEGQDQARVAKWDVQTELIGSTANFVLADRENERIAEYSFSVTSNSEVALSYDVVLTMKERLPDDVNFKIGDLSPAISDNGLIYTFSNVESVAANGDEHRHTLIIEAIDFWYRVNQNDITVQVVARQID